jgi:hypothetical protein
VNRARLAWIGAAILVLIAVGLWATARPGGEFRGLDARLSAAADETGSDGHITLREATDFEWDTAHIFGAYSSADMVAEQMDGWTPLSPAGRLVWGDLFLPNDGIQLVAFRHDGEVVAWTILNQAWMEEEQATQTFIQFDPGVLPRVASPSDEFTVLPLDEGWELMPAENI